MHPPVRCGIPSISQYNSVRSGPLFAQMEQFSNEFLAANSDGLADYARKWSPDPLHSCFRQWEYPFVFAKVTEHLARLAATSRKVVLDAGSGVTFFPYFIASAAAGAEVRCCDRDPGFAKLYSQINAASPQSVEFRTADIRELPYEDNSIDIIYCISVLEHTGDYRKVIGEFKRALADTGILVLTFDISLRGEYDIALDEAGRLLDTLHAHFPVHEAAHSYPLQSVVNSNDILTTDRLRGYDNVDGFSLPPLYRRALSSAKRLLLEGRWRRWSYNLTCYGDVYRKSDARDD